MMKTRCVSVLVLLLVVTACEKKEPAAYEKANGPTASVEMPEDCDREFIARIPVKVGETGILLPAGTRVCVSKEETQVNVELPAGYSFLLQEPSMKTLPVTYSTYTCICNKQGSPCQVFYAEGLGFGCLQSSCAGSCTGKFTYMDKTVEKVINTADKELFFSDPAVQGKIQEACRFVIVRPRRMTTPEDMVYVRQELLGVNYYLLLEKESIPESWDKTNILSARALCECNGTKVCKLRTVTLRTTKPEEKAIDIYFCDGTCNGCELTVD